MAMFPIVIRSHGRAHTTCFQLACLETRLLYCVEHGLESILPLQLGDSAPVYGPLLFESTESVNIAGAGATTGLTPALGGVPSLASNSGAAAKLYLDFDGATATNWGGYAVPATPAFDQDGDAGTFSD